MFPILSWGWLGHGALRAAALTKAPVVRQRGSGGTANRISLLSPAVRTRKALAHFASERGAGFSVVREGEKV